MGLEDRDYMRERAQERVAQPRRRRQRATGLEALRTAPFRSQSAAILIGVVGPRSLGLLTGWALGRPRS